MSTSSPAGGARRRRARRLRQLRALAILAIAGVGIGLLVSSLGGGPPPAASRRHKGGLDQGGASRSGDPAANLPATEAGILSWRLNSPLSRSVVLPSATSSSIVVAGGLEPGGSSAQGVYQVRLSNGAAKQIGQLRAPLHDASGVVLAGFGLLFGGGASSPTAAAERLATLGTAGPGQPVPATALVRLPRHRADAACVVIGDTAYVVGGYDGAAGDAGVLATSNGRSYRVVARLPEPVRYPAVAAKDGRIYVFGGDATSGPRSGDPTSWVQVVDPGANSASIVGRLPEPLTGAAAASFGGGMYIAGGETAPAAQPSRAPVAVRTIWAWSSKQHRAFVAGHLMLAVSHGGVTVAGGRAYIVGGETAPGVPTSAVQMFEPNRSFGLAGAQGAGSPFYGDRLLIADRGNNRLLLLNDRDRIIWRYPGPGEPPPPGGFYFPDDAFFTHHGTQIISNQEENETVVQIAFPSGKVLWQYGHPHRAGSLPGFLNNPDDAYLLPDGRVVVADPMNCRVLVLSPKGRILTQIGTPGGCYHHPPHFLGSPNGDTPLRNGDLLVSEINGSWIDEYTTSGRLVWTVHLPISYPSDPQPIGPDRFIVADYTHPGAFVEFNRRGKVLYEYDPPRGVGELNQPSLVERLPSGVLMANDDYNDRMVAIDPATGALVWQYGLDGVAGTRPGLLNTPDGFDVLGPGGTFPTHPATG
ncbi:MAG: PQQ-binding-like beta-propeller repeat protein [Acidimicrobiales bacterium]